MCNSNSVNVHDKKSDKIVFWSKVTIIGKLITDI